MTRMLSRLHRILGTTTQQFASPNIHGIDANKMVWSAAIACLCILLYGVFVAARVLLRG